MVGGIIFEVPVPDFVASCTETAVTVTTTGVATEGAVRTPEEEMVPPFADHVTAGLTLPVPWTFAEHGAVPALGVLTGQVTVTDVMADGSGGVCDPPPPPPQPKNSETVKSVNVFNDLCILCPFSM
jgi:hypothetical protein